MDRVTRYRAELPARNENPLGKEVGMINFGNYHHIAVTEIAAVSVRDNKEGDFPYNITVLLKSGKEFVVNWKDKKSRDEEHRRLLLQIDRETRQDFEKIYNQLWLLQDCCKRMDKRQLKIWRLLDRTEKPIE